MLVIAWGLSFAVVGVLLNLIVNLLLKHRRQRQVQYFIAFLLCICCYATHPFFKWELLVIPENQGLLSLFGFTEPQSYFAITSLWLFSEMVPWTVWVFLRAVCRDALDPLPLMAIPLAIVTVSNLYVIQFDFDAPLVLMFSNGVNFILLFMAMHEVMYGIRSDLSNRRRRFRNRVFLFLLIEIVLIFYMETSEPVWLNSGWLLATRFIVLVASILVSTLYFQASEESIAEIFYSQASIAHDDAEPLSHKGAELMQVIKTERLYQDPDLSVARLAERMAVPEHKLRDLIMKELGFRNFNAFINKFRVDYAAAQLRNNGDAPVASILVEAGFKCHPPFNRAFREVYGTSPAEYRGKLKKNLAMRADAGR